jgi:predicted RND superfamily exporter protein
LGAQVWNSLNYLDNLYPNSNELTSVVDSQVVIYSKKLEDYLSTASDVTKVKGIGNLVYDYYNKIPGSINEIRTISQSLGAKSIVSQDESMIVITLTFDEDVNSEKITKEIQEIVQTLDKPAGIRVSLVGDVFASSVVMQEIGPSMSVLQTLQWPQL